MASSRVWVVGVTLVALLLSLDAQAQKLSSPPPPKAASPPPPPFPPPPVASPPPPSPPPPSPPPPAAPPAKSGTVDIRNRIGNGPVQFAYQVGTVTYFAYTDGGSGVGVTTDKNFPGTWWQLGFDSSTPNAVTIWNAYGVAYLSNNRDSQVMDTTQAYALRIWWYFYEVGTTGTYRIGNALGKQVTYEFFSFNGVYTLEGATAWGIAGITNNAIPPVGTVDIRDKVGTGPIQLTYLAGTTTYYAYASGEGVAVTTDKTYPGTWWQVGNFDAGPTRNAVTLYHSYTQSNLTNNRDIQVVNVNKNYNTRVWWYFYSSDVNGTYKIGNVQGKQVHKEFFSFSGYYTQDYATAWRIDGVTWDVPPPAGTVDIRNRVGTGPIQLAYDSGSVTYYAYANSPGVSITTDKNYPGTWFQVGFGTGPTNAVTLFNSYSNGFLANNRDDQVIDTTNIYQTRIWWWFYEESAGSNTYKIGNILGKQISKEFFSFRSPYTLEGATAFRIIQSTWSATLHGAGEGVNRNPLPLDLDLQALHLRGAV